MTIEEDEEKGYELTKDLEDEVFHVQVYGPAYKQDYVRIRFLDGLLKGVEVRADCSDIDID